MTEQQRADIAEVVDLAVTGANLLLCGKTEIALAGDVVITDDFSFAVECANEREFLWRDGVPRSWDEFCENELGEVNGALDSMPLYRTDDSERRAATTAAAVASPCARLPKAVFHVLRQHVGPALYRCVYSRYVNGRADTFFERIFQAYKAGLWPCGIQGDFAGGNYKLICWQPPEDVSTIKY